MFSYEMFLICFSIRSMSFLWTSGLISSWNLILNFEDFWHDQVFVRVMAQIDRWTFKILSLPVFDEAFSEAIAKTPWRIRLS